MRLSVALLCRTRHPHVLGYLNDDEPEDDHLFGSCNRDTMLEISRSSRLLLPLRRQLSTSPYSWNISRPPTTEPRQPVYEQSEPELSPSQLPDPPVSTAPPPTKPKTAESSKFPNLSSYDKIVKQRIREWTEQIAIALRNRSDDLTATTKTTFSQLGSELNRITGYEAIEALKGGVVEQGWNFV